MYKLTPQIWTPAGQLAKLELYMLVDVLCVRRGLLSLFLYIFYSSTRLFRKMGTLFVYFIRKKLCSIFTMTFFLLLLLTNTFCIHTLAHRTNERKKKR